MSVIVHAKPFSSTTGTNNKAQQEAFVLKIECPGTVQALCRSTALALCRSTVPPPCHSEWIMRFCCLGCDDNCQVLSAAKLGQQQQDKCCLPQNIARQQLVAAVAVAPAAAPATAAGAVSCHCKHFGLINFNCSHSLDANASQSVVGGIRCQGCRSVRSRPLSPLSQVLCAWSQFSHNLGRLSGPRERGMLLHLAIYSFTLDIFRQTISRRTAEHHVDVCLLLSSGLIASAPLMLL